MGERGHIERHLALQIMRKLIINALLRAAFSFSKSRNKNLH